MRDTIDGEKTKQLAKYKKAMKRNHDLSSKS